MELLVANESRFERGPDGTVRCADGTFAYRFWARYLEVFPQVTVIARCRDVTTVRGRPLLGPGVELLPLADSHGAWGALRQWRTWQMQVRPLLQRRAAWLLRVPGQLGGLLANQLRRAGRPFGVEVIGDAGAVFARGSFAHPLRPGLRLLFQRWQRSACRHAQAASYVTQTTLQALYPPNPSAFVTDYSSVDLAESCFRSVPRRFTQPLQDGAHLIHVGTMTQRYKGQHHLIAALAKLRQQGVTARLTLVGDGRYRESLVAQAAHLGMTPWVEFAGQVPAGTAIVERLDSADLFVMPSLTEGLPRAMIEAQARALPCVGTTVGGIPELLTPDVCVAPADEEQLASCLSRLLSNPQRMSELSEENLHRARRYAAAELQARRHAFCLALQELSQRGSA